MVYSVIEIEGSHQSLKSAMLIIPEIIQTREIGTTKVDSKFWQLPFISAKSVFSSLKTQVEDLILLVMKEEAPLKLRESKNENISSLEIEECKMPQTE